MIKLDKTGKHRHVKLGSTLAEMTEESVLAYRTRLIASGHVEPAERVYPSRQVTNANGEAFTVWERPYMHPDAVRRYRASLIRAKFVKPVKVMETI